MKWKDYNLLHWKKNKIIKSLKIEDITILLLELDMTLIPPKEGRKNLIAIDKDENILWIADLASNTLYSSYHDVNIVDGKVKGICSSFLCEIDIRTGIILNQEFVK